MSKLQESIQHVLKKINYIEAEVEIQKQILFSIPSDNKDEIEIVVGKIAEAKDQIQILREEIKTLSPEEYENIINIEKGVAEFRKIVSEKKFKTIDNISMGQDCIIQLKNGEEIICLIKACDEDGEWTILTQKGEIVKLKSEEVVHKEG